VIGLPKASTMIIYNPIKEIGGGMDEQEERHVEEEMMMECTSTRCDFGWIARIKLCIIACI